MRCAALIAVSMLAAPSFAQVPTGAWPVAVRTAVAKATQVCREAGGRPGRSPELVKTVDLTADSIPDYVVDWSKYECVGAVSAMANGQDGSAVEVLVGLVGRNAISAYSNSVYGANIETVGETVGGRSTLWVDVAALECGHDARRGGRSPTGNSARALV